MRHKRSRRLHGRIPTEQVRQVPGREGERIQSGMRSMKFVQSDATIVRICCEIVQERKDFNLVWQMSRFYHQHLFDRGIKLTFPQVRKICACNNRDLCNGDGLTFSFISALLIFVISSLFLYWTFLQIPIPRCLLANIIPHIVT